LLGVSPEALGTDNHTGRRAIVGVAVVHNYDPVALSAERLGQNRPGDMKEQG
jgi:hypothetical protein